MKKLLILLLAAVLFTGCNPCKRLWRICPPEVHYDSVYVETVKLDTLVLISPSDTTYIEVPAVTLEGLGIIVSNSDQDITIKVKDGIFKARVICKEDSLQAVIAQKDVLLSKQETVVKKVPEPYPVKHIPKWAWICLIIVVCELICGGVWVYIKIKTGTLRTALSKFTS